MASLFDLTLRVVQWASVLSAWIGGLVLLTFGFYALWGHLRGERPGVVSGSSGRLGDDGDAGPLGPARTYTRGGSDE
jgi:hypothetical protein